MQKKWTKVKEIRGIFGKFQMAASVGILRISASYSTQRLFRMSDWRISELILKSLDTCDTCYLTSSYVYFTTHLNWTLPVQVRFSKNALKILRNIHDDLTFTYLAKFKSNGRFRQLFVVIWEHLNFTKWLSLRPTWF